MKQGSKRSILGRVVSCAFALAILALPAAAQTEAYYQEIVMEGRIYVFSSEKKYQEYQASKDMGIAITRPGYGPHGETVIFEDAAAIEAFNKKYGMTEAPPKVVKTTDVKLPFNVVWRAPGLRFSFPKFELNWSNRLQLRFTQELPENGAGQAERSSFRIRRFKTKLDGWVYTKDLTYELQLNWSDTANPLEDANVDYDLTAGKRAFRIRAGQFKVPFGRQELISSGSQQFVDRSSVSNEFARGRDIGVQLWGQFGREGVADLVEWRAGVFNGAGRTTSRNTNDAMQYNARVTVSPWGSTGYSESNLEAYPFRLSLAANYEDRDKIIRPATGAPSGDDRETFGADLSLRAAQILSVFVEYFDQDRTNPAGVTVPWDGLVGQVGVFVVPQKIEIAGRRAQLDPNGDVSNNEQIESGVAVNWFWNKHNHKIQLDYRQLENEATDVTNDEFRLQYQLIF